MRLLAFTLALAHTTIAVGEEPARKLETLLILPEPRAMRCVLSTAPEGSKLTLFTPARQSAANPTKLETYSEDAFKALGLSLDTYLKRAATSAEKRLAALKPELIRDDQGRVLYAVYRGESEFYATLLLAPSLPKVFEPMFGKEIWAALPDRHALYVFPANSPALNDFTEDLAERFHSDPFAASPEIFSLQQGLPPRVIGAFTGPEE
ncbi:MAG: hypothetical protein ACKO8Z_07970 [Prosthecobacter sp.]